MAGICLIDLYSCVGLKMPKVRGSQAEVRRSW